MFLVTVALRIFSTLNRESNTLINYQNAIHDNDRFNLTKSHFFHENTT